MSLHTGSSQMSHHLDRFSLGADFEQIAADAARLHVSTHTVRQYLDWYGKEPVTVITRSGAQSMPAYEAEIRWQLLCEKFRIVYPWERPLPAVVGR